MESMVQAIQNYYMLYLLLGLGVTLLAILIMRSIFRRKRGKAAKPGTEEAAEETKGNSEEGKS